MKSSAFSRTSRVNLQAENINVCKITPVNHQRETVYILSEMRLEKYGKDK